MPTNKYDIPSDNGWILVADANDKNVLIENKTMVPIEMVFSNTEPPADQQAVHTLRGREKFYRDTVDGNIYIRDSRDWSIDAIVVVSSRDTAA